MLLKGQQKGMILMFTSHSTPKKRPILEGIELSTLAHGQNTIMVRFDLQKGSSIPEHQHIYEQTGFLLSGRLKLTLEDKTYEAVAGDSWCIPPDAPHAAEALEACVAIEVFSPLREDYLP